MKYLETDNMRQLSAEEEEFQVPMSDSLRVPGRELTQNFTEFSMLLLQVSSTIK